MFYYSVENKEFVKKDVAGLVKLEKRWLKGFGQNSYKKPWWKPGVGYPTRSYDTLMMIL